MTLQQLRPDLLGAVPGNASSAGVFGAVFVEAPAMFKRQGVYYSLFGREKLQRHDRVLPSKHCIFPLLACPFRGLHPRRSQDRAPLQRSRLVLAHVSTKLRGAPRSSRATHSELHAYPLRSASCPLHTHRG